VGTGEEAAGQVALGRGTAVQGQEVQRGVQGLLVRGGALLAQGGGHVQEGLGLQ